MADVLVKSELQEEPSVHNEDRAPRDAASVKAEEGESTTTDKEKETRTTATRKKTAKTKEPAATGTRASTRIAKGKAKASAAPAAGPGAAKAKKKKAPAKKPKQKKPAAKEGKPAVKEEEPKGTRRVKKEEAEEDREEGAEEEKPKKKKKKKKKATKKVKGKKAAALAKLPPPLGLQTGAPRESVGWKFVEGVPNMAWKVYGDPSQLPNSDAPIVVSLTNSICQVGDAWRREMGYAGKDPQDFILWNSAALPALRAAARGANGASVFSTAVPGGGRGLAERFVPHDFATKEAKQNPDATVAASTAAVEKVLEALPPAPARPLIFAANDGIVRGALLRGKRSKTLQAIYDRALGPAEAGGLGVPCVALLVSGKTKDGAWPMLSELATEVGLPSPDLSKATFIAGAVGKNHFGPVGEHGPPSDADLQFATEVGFQHVLEVDEAFGATELRRGVEGRHGYLAGHSAGVAAARAAAEEEEALAKGPPSAAELRPPGDDGTTLIDACEAVLSDELIKNNRRLVAFFKAMEWVSKEEKDNRFRARAFAKVADTLAARDSDGVFDFDNFVKFCKPGPEKIAGFGQGSAKHAKEFFDTGTSPELMVGGGGGASGVE